MPDEKKSSETSAYWLKLAKEGKDEWNREVAQLADSISRIDFSNAKILDTIDFSGFHFPMTTDFTGATFQSEVTFANAEFHGVAIFHAATFNAGAFFDDAIFSKMVIFNDTTFKFLANFRVTQFQDLVDFHGTKFDRVAEFEEAIFYAPPMFNADGLHGYIHFNRVTKFGKQFINVKSRGAEVAYRELKLGMKRLEAHAEEDAFFRLEMLARKSQEPWARKWLYWLYEFASDYGQSIYLPVMWLGVFFLAFLWFYNLSPQFIGLGEGYDGYVNALHLALKGAFVLPGMFAGGSLEKIQLSGFGIVLAGVHWLLSAVSWFLMLLGFRNRFRLK